MKNKEDSNIWDQEVLPKLMTYAKQVDEVQHHIYYLQWAGAAGGGQQRAKSDSVGKKTYMGYLRHNCPETDNHSSGGRTGSSEATTLTPVRHWLQPQIGLAKSIPG